MKTIKIALLIILSVITLQAQEQREDYPRPLNEVEYDDNEKINIESTQTLPKLDTININWQKLNGPYGGVITALYANGDTLLVSTGMDKGIVFYSVDKGKTWHKSNFKSNEGIIDFIKTDFGIYLASCGTMGLYKSADLVSWEKVILNNLPTSLDIMFLGKDKKGGIYFTARDINNIYYSKDTLKTWKIDSQLPSGGFMGFLLHGNGDLYLGGYSVYEKRRDSVTWYKSTLQYERNLGIHLVQDEKEVVLQALPTEESSLKVRIQVRHG